MPEGYRTISGALFRAPNIEHNNRDHIPWNAKAERMDRNWIPVNGTQDFTIQEVYQKLFQKSYADWLEKEHKKCRAKDAPATYYQKILNDKQKHVSYEIIWQIGDMDDTGYDQDLKAALAAESVLKKFMERLMYRLPNVTFMSKERIEDPQWKPPFEAGIIITNLAFNGDESTPHVHMTFVPYADNCSRGQKTQNALAQTFSRMGYKTTMQQAVDLAEDFVWQDTPEGRKPQMIRNAFGAVEWIEEQKNWIANLMKLKYEWERLYKGKNQRGDLLLSDYRRERAAEKAELAVKAQEQEENKLKQIQNQAKEETEKIDKKIEQKNKELKWADDLLWLTNRNQEIKRKRTEELEQRYDAADIRLQAVNREVKEMEEKKAAVEKETNNSYARYEFCEGARIASEERLAIVQDELEKLEAGFGDDGMIDRIINLRQENEALQNENKSLRDKLEQAYDFMQQFVLGGRNLLDMFKEQIGEVIGWVQEKVGSRSR